MIISFDLGMYTGYAVFRKNGELQMISEITSEGFCQFRENLERIYNQYPNTEVVIFEIPPYCGNVMTFKKLCFYEFYLRDFFEDKCALIGLEVKKWKKSFLGNGNANKKEVKDKVESILKKKNLTQNQCDAYGIGRCFFKGDFFYL